VPADNLRDNVSVIESREIIVLMQAWYEQRFAPAPGSFLCHTSEIDPGRVKEFRFGGDSPFAFRLFIYNDQGEYRAFRNSCPHFGVPLNHEPGELFTPDGQYFLCMTHHATFDKHSGTCVAGPCEGQALEHIPLRHDEGRLLVADPD